MTGHEISGSTPAAARRASRRTWYPPTRAPKTGPEAPAPAAMRSPTAAVSDGAPASRRVASAGSASRTPMSPARLEYTPPSIGSTLRATTEGPNRSATSCPTDVSVPASHRIERSDSPDMRSTSSGSARPSTTAGPAGMPISAGLGNGCNRLPDHTAGRRGVGETIRSARPSSVTSSSASGRRTMNASAPTSTARPPTVVVCRTPPTRPEASSRSRCASGPSARRRR